MTSWITYARPFARRRAIYREKAAFAFGRGNSEGHDRYDFAAEAVNWTWADFRNKLLKNPTPKPEINQE